MKRIKYITLVTFLLTANLAFAQKAERDYLRKGNRFFNDSSFVNAEVNYRKALEVNPQSTESMYNLGNTLSQEQKAKEALEQYDAAARVEKNKMKLAKIYHNSGVLMQAGKQYAQCIEAYKQALRNNPKDDETRYNLALAQKQLKDQQQNQDNKENKENKEDQQKEQDKKDQEQKNQDQQKKDQQPPKPQEQNKNEMSKENAQQLLNSVIQDEKQVQDKVKKLQQQVQSGKLDKDW